MQTLNILQGIHAFPQLLYHNKDLNRRPRSCGRKAPLRRRCGGLACAALLLWRAAAPWAGAVRSSAEPSSTAATCGLRCMPRNKGEAPDRLHLPRGVLWLREHPCSARKPLCRSALSLLLAPWVTPEPAMGQASSLPEEAQPSPSPLRLTREALKALQPEEEERESGSDEVRLPRTGGHSALRGLASWGLAPALAPCSHMSGRLSEPLHTLAPAPITLAGERVICKLEVHLRRASRPPQQCRHAISHEPGRRRAGPAVGPAVGRHAAPGRQRPRCAQTCAPGAAFAAMHGRCGCELCTYEQQGPAGALNRPDR